MRNRIHLSRKFKVLKKRNFKRKLDGKGNQDAELVLVRVSSDPLYHQSRASIASKLNRGFCGLRRLHKQLTRLNLKIAFPLISISIIILILKPPENCQTSLNYNYNNYYFALPNKHPNKY